MLSDAELFDFNAALIADYDDERAHAALAEHGAAFRYQLVMALQFDAWAEKLEDRPPPDLNEIEIRGWVNALKNVAALIRQTEYLPGGSLFDQVAKRGRV